MPREIKFRAWVEGKDIFSNPQEKGIMFTGFGFDDLYSGRDEANMYCENGIIWEEPDFNKCVLMQYTGLKDKNGKKIYEGDIFDGGVVVAWNNGMSGYYVTKNGEGFHLSHEQHVLNGRIKHREVIGNIYENPELMEVK
jgi:uncharacterized phage protein (TIGR01671 family)